MTGTRIDRRQFFGRAGAAGLAGVGALAMPGLALGATGRVRRGFQDCRFGQIHYRYTEPVAGKGHLPLVCLHASPGSGITYARFLPLMGTDRQVIAPDTPGYGLSDPPPTRSTIGDFAAATIELIEALGLKKIDLLGNHTSSATAVELALRRPDLVRRIVLNSALLFTPEEAQQMRKSTQAREATTFDEAADKVPQGWRQIRGGRMDLSDEEAWAFYWEVTRNPVRSNWGYYAAFDYDFAAALPRIEQPMLVLSPDDVLRAPTQRAQGRMRHGRVMELPWKQGTFGEHAADVAAIMRRFLDSPAV